MINTRFKKPRIPPPQSGYHPPPLPRYEADHDREHWSLWQERDAASSVIALWFKKEKARRKNEKSKDAEVRRNGVPTAETALAVNMVNKYKLLREVKYLLERAEGNFDGGAAEAGISLSDKLKALKDTTIGKGADGNASIIQTNFELRSKLTGLEETNAAMLSKVSDLSAKLGR